MATMLETTRRQAPSRTRREKRREMRGKRPGWVNVGGAERAVSLASGLILIAIGVARRRPAGAFIAGVGGAMIYRGATGHSYAYEALGISTRRREELEGRYREEITRRGIHVEEACLINRSPAELYRRWRDLENLPSIMTHLRSVRTLDERRSQWVAHAPRLAGGSVEWLAEVTRDDPNSLIAWRSLPGSDIECAGEVRFVPAVGDRGTEVHVLMDYVAPAGRLGHWFAALFGESPQRQMREDLRKFKRLMETGEVPTVMGQPRGTCVSLLKRSLSALRPERKGNV